METALNVFFKYAQDISEIARAIWKNSKKNSVSVNFPDSSKHFHLCKASEIDSNRMALKWIFMT